MREDFKAICEFRKKNSVKSGPIKTNDPVLDEVKIALNNIKVALESKFKGYRGHDLNVVISEGQSYFPNVIHICVLPKGQLVSNGIYVAICFDITGKGGVIGCAESVTNPKGLNTKIRRYKNNNKLIIDVDGGRPTTKYNNAFENPYEFFIDSLDETKLYRHINESINLALYHLGIEDSTKLTIDNITNANSTNYVFDPKNIQDAREKISKQIIARRGQKKFRDALLKEYDYKCAITGCNVLQVLEAAHIHPYKGESTNFVQNGILLRSDMHLLFDLGYVTIVAETKKVKVHQSLLNTIYFKYNGIEINLPMAHECHPNIEVLRYHNEFEFKA